MESSNIIQTEYSEHMQKAFIDYAMSHYFQSAAGCQGWI